MRDHAADRPVEDFRGRTVMEGAGLFRVDDVPLMEEVMVSELLVSRAKQTRRHIQRFGVRKAGASTSRENQF